MVQILVLWCPWGCRHLLVYSFLEFLESLIFGGASNHVWQRRPTSSRGSLNPGTCYISAIKNYHSVIRSGDSEKEIPHDPFTNWRATVPCSRSVGWRPSDPAAARFEIGHEGLFRFLRLDGWPSQVFSRAAVDANLNHFS